LSIWGGVPFLLNKVLLAGAEQQSKDAAKRKWRTVAWVVYLVGLPAWLIIFVIEHNWIVLAVETAGVPSVVLALTSARYGQSNNSKWLIRTALVAAGVGLAASVYDFGGLNTVEQFLELLSNAGLLVGTYLLARERASGFLWYMLMNVSMGTLMGRQEYWWLCTQQFASLGFVVLGYVFYRRKHSR
jgi:hypothetical protein